MPSSLNKYTLQLSRQGWKHRTCGFKCMYNPFTMQITNKNLEKTHQPSKHVEEIGCDHK